MATYAHSATFSTTGDATGTVSINPGDTVGYESVIAGGEELTGTIRVEESDFADMGWVSVAEITDTVTATGSYVNLSDHKKYYRMHAYSMVNSLTDDAVCSLGVAAAGVGGLEFVGGDIVDEHGTAVASFTDSGVSFPGTQEVVGAATVGGTLGVTGAMTASDDITVTKTVTAGSATEYGFVHSTGLYDDLVVNMVGLNPPGGASDPDIDTTTGIPMFDKASTEVMSFAAQLPHSWKSGGTSALHVHCMADQATDPVTSPAEAQTDGVFTAATRNFNSAAATFTGMEGQYITVTGTGTGESAVVGSYQILTVTDANNVILEDTAAAAALADDGEVAIAYSVYLDTVRLSINYKVIPVNGTWDQASATTVATTGRLPIHDTDAVQALIPIADIDLAAFQDSAIIVGRISRIGGNGEDKYDDDLHVLSADFHIKKNTMGSLAATGEDF